MKTVFRIAEFDKDGKLTLLEKEYESYTMAEEAIVVGKDLPLGTYQIQKVFVKTNQLINNE